MNPLVPCPTCDRHVRASETACPFCDSALPTDLASRAVPPANRRLNRAAAFTFAASLAVVSASVSTAACGGVVEGPDDHGGGQAMYGIARVDDGGAVIDDGGTAALYGLAYVDSGAPEDGGGILPMYGAANPDAGEPPDDGGIVAAYGLPGH
jgi:hypothetical protein